MRSLQLVGAALAGWVAAAPAGGVTPLPLAVAVVAALHGGIGGAAAVLAGVAGARLADGAPPAQALAVALGVALPAWLGAVALRRWSAGPLPSAAVALLVAATSLLAAAPWAASWRALAGAFPGLLVAAGLGILARPAGRRDAAEAAHRTFLASVLEALPTVVFMKDAGGRYTVVNRAVERFFEADRSQILGRTDTDLFPQEVAARLQAEDREVRDTGGILEREQVIPRHGEPRVYHVSKFPLRGRRGELVAVGGVATDITEAHRLTRALQESEARLRDVVEHSSNLFYVHTTTHVFTYVSPQSRHFFGCEPEEAMVHWTDFVTDPESQARAMASTEAAIATGTAQPPYEVLVSRRDGRQLWVEVSEAPVVRDGRTVAIVGALTDIDERRRAEHALRKTASLLEATLEASSEGILVVDLHGRVTHANRRFREMWGYTPELLAAREDRRLVHAAQRLLRVDADAFTARVRAIYAEPERDSADVLVLRDGRIFERYSRPQRLDREVVGRVWSFRDVTARRAAEEELRRHRDNLADLVQERTRALAEANRELESFCSTVAHDLRAPLRAIDAFSRILEAEAREQLDENASWSLARIRAAAGRMAALIDDLLELARVSRCPLARVPVDLAELARSVLADLQAAEPDRTVLVEVQDPLLAEGDRTLIRSVVQNLLDNAWKFTSGRPVAHITVGARQEGGERVFFVSDDGAGFDMAYAARLFAPFERLHGPKEFAGTGIGLAIVHRIVQRHGGRIWARGEVGRGATFSFTLEPPAVEPGPIGSP